ncbi:MAG TPA: nicotinate-nucleotide adenylyltransferase [Pyrinomonadaceae bacterium]|nr:nicotinate-nucleotide adenylyltransferase [Pyrinomonadaceae bacterium]
MTKPKRIAFYGGTFDPVHCGHITVAKRLLDLFRLDEFVFLPAFHAPHKPERMPTSAYHRFAMLTLATRDEPGMSVSTLELVHGQKRYTVETLPEIMAQNTGSSVFFVMGADSWGDITTWREWEKVLLMTNHIVVTRPGYEIDFDHVSDEVRERIVDLRKNRELNISNDPPKIYITDAVKLDVSATGIREDVGEDNRLDRQEDVPQEVAKYIEKYELYR